MDISDRPIGFCLVSAKFLVFCAFILAGLPGFAGEQDGATAPQGKLKLEVLLQELLRSNPELQAARKQVEAALTRPPQESALPDPRMTAGWISNGWPYPGAGLGTDPTSNIGFQVAQEFPFPGKRALKAGIADKEAERVAQNYRATQLRLVAELEENFYDLVFANESSDLIRQNQQLLEQMAKVAEIRYSVGKAMQQDIIKTGIEVAILENRLIALEQKKQRLAARINALLNRPPDLELAPPEPVGELPPLEPYETVRARALQSSPALEEQRSVIDSRQLAIQSAQKAYYPDFDVMTGYYNQGSLKPMWEFKVQFNIPLYFAKKQRYGLEEAGAGLAEAQRTYRNEQQTVLFGVRDRYLAAETAKKLMDLYSRQVVPQSELALKSSLAGYETGEADLLTVLSNFNTIRDYRMNYYEQRAEYLKALSKLREIAGDAIRADAGRKNPENEVP